MKAFNFLVFLILANSTLLFSQVNNVSIVTMADLPDTTFTVNDADATIKSSFTNKGLKKLCYIHPDSMKYDDFFDNITWPAGSWGRGYYGVSDFRKKQSDSSYFGCHPLYRVNSYYLRSHIHLNNVFNDKRNILAISDGLNYLIQDAKANTIEGKFIGFKYYQKRASQSNPADATGSNSAYYCAYESSYALAALSDGYLYIRDYNNRFGTSAFSSVNMNELQYTINLVAQKIVTQKKSSDNYNYKALQAWGLSLAYKATLNCDYLQQVMDLCDAIMENQHVDEGKDGCAFKGDWHPEVNDWDTTCKCYSETKIWYHCIILRGLYESLDIIPYSYVSRRTSLANSVKLAVNHIITSRLDPDSTSPKLKYATTADSLGDYSNWVIEPIAELTYYSNHFPEFSPSDRLNLKNLLNRLAKGIKVCENRLYDVHQSNFILPIPYYADYINAINNSSEVLPWVGPNPYYDANKITGRTISGKFDGNGYTNIAAFYDYGDGKARIHVWSSNGENFSYSNFNQGWWESPAGFDINKIEGRIIVGNFCGDSKDDIAAFYNCGYGQTKLLVWESKGTYFLYKENGNWINNGSSIVSGFDANKITGRVVSGDFYGDSHDDIAAFYDYGDNKVKLLVWQSNGNSFNYFYGDNWVNSGSSLITGFDANKITGRVVSGNYYGDSRDDIAAYYDYGDSKVKLLVWQSNGSSFSYRYGDNWVNSGSSLITGFDANKITGRIVSGNFYGDSNDDIAAFYDYGNQQIKLLVWQSAGSSFNYRYGDNWVNNGSSLISGYDANKITGRVVSGNFNSRFINITNEDIAAYYDFGNGDTRIHVWLSNGNSMIYSGTQNQDPSGGWWMQCLDNSLKSASMSYSSSNEPSETNNLDEINTNKNNSENLVSEVKIFPNPNNGKFIVSSKKIIRKIEVFDLIGTKVYSSNAASNQIEINFSNQMKGFYIVRVYIDSIVINERILIE